MIRPLAFGLMLTACAEAGDPGAPDVVEDPCPSMLCDDGDDCTEDRCDPVLGCFAVPRDAADACRNDLQCDDRVTCTDDRCVVDECGLERCVHDDPKGECRPCFRFDQCTDGDSCTDDRCVKGFCEHTPEVHCDPTCEPGTAVPFPYEVAEVRWDVPATCDACPCESEPLYHAVESGEVSALVVDDARCQVVCGDGGDAVDCAPLVYGVGYRVFGTRTEDGFVVERWCTQDILAQRQPLHGTVALDGVPPKAVRLVATPVEYELRCAESDCAPLFSEPMGIAFVQPWESQGQVFSLVLDDTSLLAVLVPTPDGVAGVVREVVLQPGAVAREGELVLHLDTDPRPVDAATP